ncbi:MAG: aminoacyl-tRNA hydrolase [Deltaproteobacteria bacterium]|uniref:alternative ribosome rescue aminoacyl-tRNA hydrolase ArfB n=1 Tax=Desulfosarcina sp. BuS5 TaxID=933262 RepID=UPI000483963E|nr:alternative ribosome rescue aminoacyl-tRNA hydrolase ArfB [Desulfosarcina sp. BuS5]MCD6274124.1 aminoacyl-tRNA hydrolase [Deltaproteobacteria bacterium]WDN88538.1 ribosome-associated protein [Desulfosarcina sp. BuS5]
MIYVNSNISIDEKEIKLDFIRASGPGGQNVNKVASAVQLRFDVEGSSSLPDKVRARLVLLAGRRITDDGILIIKAERFRTQALNRQDAINRLTGLIREALKEPKIRRKTKPSASSKRRMLDGKRHRSNLKKLRKSAQTTDD